MQATFGQHLYVRHNGTEAYGTFQGAYEHGGVTYWLVSRDDGQQGHGPRGEWMVPPETCEPSELPNGTEVGADTNAPGLTPFYSTVAGRCSNGGYRLHGSQNVYFRNQLVLSGPVGLSADLPSQAWGLPAEPQQHDLTAETDPPEGYAYDSEGTLHKLNDGGRYASPLPNDSAARKELPLGKVFFGMFPAAMVGVTENVMAGNRKHLGDDPDIPKHDRSKSADHLDCIMRHAMDGDIEAVATRALMWLQEVREAEGAPRAPRAFNFHD